MFQTRHVCSTTVTDPTVTLLQPHTMSADAKPVLYHSIYMCSSRPLAVIHEMGIEDKVDVKVICDHAELKKPEFLALNPHGTVCSTLDFIFFHWQLLINTGFG